MKLIMIYEEKFFTPIINEEEPEEELEEEPEEETEEFE